MRLWEPVAAGVVLEAAWLTLLTRRTGGFRTLFGWQRWPAGPSPRLGEPMKMFVGYPLYGANQGRQRLVRPEEHPGAVWVLARPRCVGSWRLAGILRRLAERDPCPLPLVWVVSGPGENVRRCVREAVAGGPAYGTTLQAARVFRIPRAPFALQVDREGVVRQVGVVDTLQGLVRFVEGCADPELQGWLGRCLAEEGVPVLTGAGTGQGGAVRQGGSSD